MSERFHTIVVVLDRDVHEDDVSKITSAIECLHGVVSAKAKIATYEDYAARARVKSDIREKIWKLWKDLDE